MGQFSFIIFGLFAGFLRLVRCDNNITIYADNQALDYRNPYAKETVWYNKDYGCPVKETHGQNATVSFTFNGTSVQAWLLSANTTSRADFYIDGVYKDTMNTWSNTSYTDCLYKYWNSPLLPAGEHTITTSHGNLDGHHPNLDFVKYTYVPSSTDKGHKLSLGAKAGIVLGGIAVLSFVGSLFRSRHYIEETTTSYFSRTQRRVV
ncbi:uncharacterized protein EI90DRAFT_1760019 [Cantharellus anzutake]|uniref:uncharacterized protein n=1 Tax=Cantharellus anzutake TaxID=1750568 RepID=UPI0019044E9A|nr:uncharacterized protein EI90DRAFT_1760019 [Cantharellus anzutake]KAF8341626.1 hypothetical protein EI90DRAFT_1760019 [Cantharellus anzutake]